MAKLEQRTRQTDSLLDWQFPDEETWTAAQTNAPAPPGLQTRPRGLTEQHIALLLITLISVAYWLWSEAKSEEERNKTVMRQPITQESPIRDAEPNSLPSSPSAPTRRQTPLAPPTLGTEDRSHDPAPSSQQESICFWSHIACNTSP